MRLSHPIYIARIRLDSDGTGAISSVATWFRVRIFNNTADGLIVRQIRFHGRRLVAEPLAFVTDMSAHAGKITNFGTIWSPPATIASKQVLDLFVLVETRLESFYSERLTARYPLALKTGSIKKMFEDIPAILREHFRHAERDLGLRVSEVGMRSLEPGMLTVHKDGIVQVDPTLPLIPSSAPLDARNAAYDQGLQAPLPRRSKFKVTVELIGEPPLSVEVTTKAPEWFA